MISNNGSAQTDKCACSRRKLSLSFRWLVKSSSRFENACERHTCHRLWHGPAPLPLVYSLSNLFFLKEGQCTVVWPIINRSFSFAESWWQTDAVHRFKTRYTYDPSSFVWLWILDSLWRRKCMPTLNKKLNS